MEIELQRDGEIPVGVQLTWALRARILDGELSSGERLPGVRELAADTGVNTNTVRTVYARLEADGLIRSEHGRGTFVSENAIVDERLAGITRRALEEARSAGLDPRQVAAALFGGLGAQPQPTVLAAAGEPDSPAARRRALRAEIAALERELADARLARSLRDSTAEPDRAAGARLLGEDELREQRDALAARLLATTREPAAPRSQPATARSATRPGLLLRPHPGT
jgi:DNA-binding transcriptional regulator YhcF (GntR family)